MIRKIFDHPLTRLLLFYFALVTVTAIMAQFIPVIGQSLQSVDIQSGITEWFGDERRSGVGGFLQHPNVELRTAIAIIGALLLVAPIAWVYMVTRRESRYDKSLVHTLILLPPAVTGIVIIVQSSLTLAFALGGIVAAVRFRNTLQDTKDAVYVFLAIGVGLAGGIQALPVALIVSGIFNVIIILLWQFEVGDIYSPAKQVTAMHQVPAEATKSITKTPPRKRGSAMFRVPTAARTMESDDQIPVPGASPVLNPELSLLEFNARVLAMAEDPILPPLARLRFLAIFSANLDEFFMVRVGGLKQAVAEGITKRSIDGQTPAELLQAVHVKLRALVRRQYRCLQGLLEGGLEPAGIGIRAIDDLDEGELEYLRDYFDERVLPFLTPKAITLAGGHPFPYIEELLLSLAVVIRDPRTDRDHFVHLEITDALPRFVQLPESFSFVPIEEVIRANIEALYPGRQVLEVHPFRITRSAEIKFDEKHAANFLEAMEEELRRRPHGAIVRIEVSRMMPFPIRDLLLRELKRDEESKGVPLVPSDLHEVDGMVDLGSLHEIVAVGDPTLDFPPFTAAEPIPAGESMFEVIERGDVLVYHPYDSFEATTERFLLEAAEDPRVVAIKLTLYRPGGPSKLADALVRAAAQGKTVSVFVEVKARFDEELNILWAKQLERGGIHVVTGLVKYKTHAKLALVVRRDGERVARYAHIGTGNYNRDTARVYTDLGFLTADEDICNDVTTLFNELTGSSRPPAAEFSKLLVAPTNLLERFVALIDREAEHATAGRPSGIRVKINGLADGEIIEALYRASGAGVPIDLLVRGICAARPGVPALSDRIRIRSAVGRFLEHARIFRFENGGQPAYYIGSADWRPRNLRRRVEIVCPVDDPDARKRLDEILDLELSDAGAWELAPDGSYAQRGEESVGSASQAQETMVRRLISSEVAGSTSR